MVRPYSKDHMAQPNDVDKVEIFEELAGKQLGDLVSLLELKEQIRVKDLDAHLVPEGPGVPPSVNVSLVVESLRPRSERPHHARLTARAASAVADGVLDPDAPAKVAMSHRRATKP